MTEDTPKPLTLDDFEVAEWDRRSPINGVPAATYMLHVLRETDGRPCPDARVLLLREKTTGVALYAQHLAVWNNSPLVDDHDVERMRAWLVEHRMPQVLARPELIAMAAMKARESAEMHEQRQRALLGTGVSRDGTLTPFLPRDPEPTIVGLAPPFRRTPT